MTYGTFNNNDNNPLCLWAMDIYGQLQRHSLSMTGCVTASQPV